MRLQCSNEISSPPEVVFPWIAEPTKAMQWQRNVRGGKVITTKPEVVGTVFKETLEEDGRTLEMEGVITHYEPNRLIAFHLTSRIHEFDVSYSLEALDSATRLSIDAIVKWRFPMNFISAFIGKKIERRLTEQLNSEVAELKRMCEREQPHSGSTADADRR